MITGNKFHFFVKMIVISVFLIFVGCAVMPLTPIPTEEVVSPIRTMATSPALPTQTLFPVTQIPSTIPNLLPTPTTTLTSTPSIGPTTTKSPYAIPTPPVDEVTEQVLWLYETNNNCQFPCWWGITPGQTEWSTAEVFLKRFDPYIFGSSWGLPSTSGLVYYVPSIPLPPEINSGSQTEPWILVQSGVVEKMQIHVSSGDTPPGYLTQYTLSAILTTYGQPTEVWVATYRDAGLGDGGEAILPFVVVLFYSDQGIAVLYYDNGNKQENVIQGCPQQDPARTLGLWSSGQNLTFEQATRYLARFNYEYLSLAESTEMDVATFYETFMNRVNTTCLDTLASLWP